jgi:GDSL-like Lipase/Acylhydrolase family/Subtilase family
MKRSSFRLLAVGLAVAFAASGAALAPSAAAEAAVTAKPPVKTATNYRRVCAAPARGHFACLVLQRTDITARAGLLSAGTPGGYGPADLDSAYKLPAGDAGAGQTVALVDAYNDPDAAQDLTTYRQQYGLPPCTTASGCFRKVNQKGQARDYPSDDPDWGLEESLDIQMVSAICPACHILLVEASSESYGDLAAAVNTAVRLGATSVSNSYGGPEFAELSKYLSDYDHPGVAITVASGDDGYGVNDPAGFPGVISVGGTSLLPAANSRGWDEIVWTGSGSGCSIWAKPEWQTDSGCHNRTDNDVAAVADPETPVAVYDSYGQGGWNEVGGTSVASPIIASVYALAGRPAAGTNPASYLYTPQPHLFGIVAGTNQIVGNCKPAYLCNGGPGYNGPGGEGSPDGVSQFSAPFQYVAMGDSYSAGEGIPPYYPGSDTKTNTCHRSKAAYPTMIKLPGQPVPVAQDGSDNFAFIACSGAETTGITDAAVFAQNADEKKWNAAGNTDWGKPQDQPGGPQANRPQLGPGTSLVTLTVGGNDARFADVLTGCLILAKALLTHCSSPGYTLRRVSKPKNPKDPMPLVKFEPKVIGLLKAHLEATYKAIHEKAPNAEIIVAGYPLLFPFKTTSSCRVGSIAGVPFTLNAADQNWLNDDTGTLLNAVIQAAVADVHSTGVNIHFVDPTTIFGGHSICSSDPWINGLIGFYKGPSGSRVVNPASFHPNKAGQQAYATLINACLDGTMSC